MKLRFSAYARAGTAALLVAIASASTSTSCMVTPVTIGETHVGRAELYRTGNARYDDFFTATHDLQTKAVGILDEEKKARSPLADALAKGDEPLDQLVQPAKARAKKYAKAGAGLRLETDGLDEQGKPVAGKKVSVSVLGLSSVSDDAEGKKFGAALGQTSEASAQLLTNYGTMAEEARKLAAGADELRAALPEAFPGAWNRRDEISNELGAAKLILLAAADRSEKVVGPIEVFFRELGERAGSAPSSPPPAAVASAPEKPLLSKGKKTAKKAPAPSAAPAPQPAAQPKHESEPAPEPKPRTPPPAPKAPSGGGDDFNP